MVDASAEAATEDARHALAGLGVDRVNALGRLNAEDITASLPTVNEIFNLGHRSALRLLHEKTAAISGGQSRPEIHANVGGSCLQAIQAVYAMANGNTEEARRFLGPQVERQDARLKQFIRDAHLGEPARES